MDIIIIMSYRYTNIEMLKASDISHHPILLKTIQGCKSHLGCRLQFKYTHIEMIAFSIAEELIVSDDEIAEDKFIASDDLRHSKRLHEKPYISVTSDDSVGV